MQTCSPLAATDGMHDKAGGESGKETDTLREPHIWRFGTKICGEIENRVAGPPAELQQPKRRNAVEKRVPRKRPGQMLLLRKASAHSAHHTCKNASTKSRTALPARSRPTQYRSEEHTSE